MTTLPMTFTFQVPGSDARATYRLVEIEGVVCVQRRFRGQTGDHVWSEILDWQESNSALDCGLSVLRACRALDSLFGPGSTQVGMS